MRCIMVVEDCFTVDGKGLAVVGNQLTQAMPLKSSVVELRRRGRQTLSTMVVDASIFSSPMDGSTTRSLSMLLPANLQVDDVPLGSEIWQSPAMP